MPAIAVKLNLEIVIKTHDANGRNCTTILFISLTIHRSAFPPPIIDYLISPFTTRHLRS